MKTKKALHNRGVWIKDCISFPMLTNNLTRTRS